MKFVYVFLKATSCKDLLNLRIWSLKNLVQGVQFDLVNVDLSLKPRWYKELNPAGLVPAVEWRGHVQTESLDICR